jgi:hypothetical protein
MLGCGALYYEGSGLMYASAIGRLVGTCHSSVDWCSALYYEESGLMPMYARGCWATMRPRGVGASCCEGKSEAGDMGPGARKSVCSGPGTESCWSNMSQR